MKTAVKEKPILFSGPMVRAILEGRKTQTRRVVKLDRELILRNGDLSKAWVDPGGTLWGPGPYLKVPCTTDIDGSDDGGTVQRLHCPYGYPECGSRLWVREAWSRDHAAFYPNFPIIYRADGYDPRDKFESFQSSVYSPESKRKHYFAWRPSIHMKRADSRLSLEITEVRVQRLQDISEEDARAEGVPFSLMASTHRLGFENLWGSINGADSWESNPWVWCLSFASITKT